MGAQKNSPKAPLKRATTLQRLFELDAVNFSSISNNMKQSSCESEKEELLTIISHCSVVYTFKDQSESQSQRELKRRKLSELLHIIKTSKNQFDDEILAPLFSMVSANLFRPLPPPSNPSYCYDGLDEEDLAAAPAAVWPHLYLVYDIFLKLVLNSDPKILGYYVDQPFLLNLLSVFQSEDARERESLKNVYHRIYSKFTFHRSFMRKTMNNVFLHFVFETERHCGIGELLEIWGSIINGFTVPLKEEHRMFLTRVLVPLHKPKGMQAYHRQLAYCVSQFVQKEPALGGVVVRGVLKYWPLTNCQKEVLLIGELEEVVEKTDPELFGELALPVCFQIARSLNSWNSQVAERALYVWNNEYYVKMAAQKIDEVLPAVVESIEKNINWHWSKTVRQLTESVKTMLEEMAPGLYSQCLEELNLRQSMAGQEEMKRKEKWERLEMVAAKNQLQQSHCIHVSY